MEAGANQYFGKSAADVTIAEAASIAAITKNPSRFNPYTNPEEHLKRRDDIILFMQQQGYITQAEAEAAWATPLNLVEKDHGRKRRCADGLLLVHRLSH